MNHPGLRVSGVVALSSALAALIHGAACTGTVVADTEIGPAGGTIDGPNGVQAIIPAGALAQPTSITIRAVPAASAPARPSGLTYVGEVYSFEPHGLAFDAPVQVRLPLPSLASTAEVLHASCAANSVGAASCAPWDAPLGGVTFQAGFAAVSTRSFSLYAAAENGAGGAGGASSSASSSSGGGAGGASSSASSASSSSGSGGGCGFSVSGVSSYPVGTAPGSVALADLNGDGKPDLAVANDYGNGNAVSVLINAGDGTFGTATQYAIGAAYDQFVAAGDLNGDGKIDLVVVSTVINQANGQVSVLLNAGNGTFAAPVVYPVATQLGLVAVGDLNGDGKPDVVVSGGSNVTVMLNAGNGTLAAPVEIAVGTQLAQPVLQDLNGDGKPDIAVVTGSGVSVLLNTGNGTFAAPVAYAAGQTPTTLAVGDLNGDGKPDLAITDQGTGTVQVLLNAGGGAFSPATGVPVGQGPFSVAMGDLDGDGKTDLAVTLWSDSTVRVLLNNGNATFTAGSVVMVGVAAEGLVVADLNGDGRLDLALGNAMGNTVSVLLQCH
jgi:hypothetical protein